jgi:hypothetical protein
MLSMYTFFCVNFEIYQMELVFKLFGDRILL